MPNTHVHIEICIYVYVYLDVNMEKQNAWDCVRMGPDRPDPNPGNGTCLVNGWRSGTYKHLCCLNLNCPDPVIKYGRKGEIKVIVFNILRLPYNMLWDILLFLVISLKCQYAFWLIFKLTSEQLNLNSVASSICTLSNVSSSVSNNRGEKCIPGGWHCHH